MTAKLGLTPCSTLRLIPGPNDRPPPGGTTYPAITSPLARLDPTLTPSLTRACTASEAVSPELPRQRYAPLGDRGPGRLDVLQAKRQSGAWRIPRRGEYGPEQ